MSLPRGKEEALLALRPPLPWKSGLHRNGLCGRRERTHGPLPRKSGNFPEPTENVRHFHSSGPPIRLLPGEKAAALPRRICRETMRRIPPLSKKNVFFSEKLLILEENGILLHQEWLIGHQYHAQINIRVSLSNKFEFGSNCLIFQIFFENFEFVFFVAKLRFRLKWQ